MREMYGIEAYQLFTMDKVVQNIVRQVQHLVMDDIPSRLTKLFEDQKEKGGTGGRWITRHQRAALEQAYLRQAEAILVDDNPFKFVFRSLTAQMEIDMLDPPPESNDSVKETSTWSSYLNEFATTKKNEEFLHKVGNSRAIYLFRNKRRNPYWKDFKKQHNNLLKDEKDEEEEEEDDDEDDEDDDDEDGEDEDRKRKSNKEKKGGKKLEKKYVADEDESHKGKSEVAQDSETSEKEKSPSETRIHKPFEGVEPDRPGATPAATTTDDYDDENIDDAAALARAGRTPMGGDDDDDDDDKRGGADSDGGLGDDEDDEKGAESTSKRRKIGSSPDGLARRVHSIDTTSVKFQQNSYHHMFVKDTGMFMYHHQRLARTHACHKKVTQKKYRHMTN